MTVFQLAVHLVTLDLSVITIVRGVCCEGREASNEHGSHTPSLSSLLSLFSLSSLLPQS